jgi:large subunit ribosomal protein L23
VIKINTINKKAKTKSVRGKLGFKKGFKKAVITLKKGQSIDLGSGA